MILSPLIFQRRTWACQALKWKPLYFEINSTKKERGFKLLNQNHKISTVIHADSVSENKQSFKFNWKGETAKFVSSFPSFQSDFSNQNQCNPLTENQETRIQSILNYNVSHGKNLRFKIQNAPLAIIFMKWCEHLKGADITNRELNLMFKIGWVFETFHSFACVTDDIVDNGKLRHGRPCWHKLENVGKSMAIIDGLILQNGVMTLLSKYLSGTSYHLDVLNLFNLTNYQTTLGQSLDMETSRTLQPTEYSMKLYETIAMYKTGFYTFYCPIVTSLLMNHKKNEALFKLIQNLSMELCLHFQIQDDFLDCFGSPEKIKKTGNDIEEGKCTWLIVTALEKANSQQMNILLENFGKPHGHCVDIVKKLYEEIGIVAYHEECVKNREKRILQQIQSLPEFMPKDFMVEILHRLSRRTF